MCLLFYFTLTTLAWLSQSKMLVSVGIRYAVTVTYSVRNGGNLLKYASTSSLSARGEYRAYQSVGILCVTSVFLLTPWSRVLLEKLTGSQLVKTLLAFFVIRRFITAFTSARHLSLS